MKKLWNGTLAVALVSVSTLGNAQQATTPGYMIANYDIKNQAVFEQYMDAAGPLAPKYGGKVIVFNVSANSVEGKSRSVMAVAEFPSLAQAQRFYNSPEYTRARALRTASTEGSVVITEGFVFPKQ
ncbi:DUF1330 domain-containing protein [Alcaligenaceae bacterium C4P045]|nr:DUF1330 domain-containing protein [Alcaligenaceae bacterium C4P045]